MTTKQLAEQAMQPLMRQVQARTETLRLRGELRSSAEKLKALHSELRELETQIDDLAILYGDKRQRKALVIREIMLLERDGAKAIGAA
jgi:uncharacterized protein YlxW (UPF0749 family)